MFDFHPWGTNVLLQSMLMEDADSSWRRGERIGTPRERRWSIASLLAKAASLLKRSTGRIEPVSDQNAMCDAIALDCRAGNKLAA